MGIETFSTRLEKVLGERKLTPWAASLGLSSSTITSMAQGKPPKADKLLMIHRAELVNLNWLLDGQGAPYSVTRHEDAGALVEAVALRLAEESWDVDLLFEEGPHCVVILSNDGGSQSADGPMTVYKVREMFHGPLHPDLAELLMHHAGGGCVVRRRLVDGAVIGRIGRGEIGPHDLFGSATGAGMLGDSKSFNDLQRIAEAAAIYSSDVTVRRAQEEVETVVEAIESVLEERAGYLDSRKKGHMVAMLLQRCLDDRQENPSKADVLRLVQLASDEDQSMCQIRVPAEMKNRLQEAAKKSHRSLNAEILFRLQVSLDGPRESAEVAEASAGYPLSDGEKVLLGKLRRLGGRHAATAADVIDALASSSNDAE